MSKYSNKKALISILVVMVMVLSAFLVITPTSSATPANTNGSGKMQVSTDLGNNVTLVAGSIGITLPNAINKNYTTPAPVSPGTPGNAPTYVTVGESVLFTVSSATGGLPPYSYSWEFYNAAGTSYTTATGQSTWHIFNHAGTHKVVSIVTDGVGNTASTSYNVTVYNPLQITVTASPANVYIN
ncbi:MAG: PKD domain-containing protein, partial [Thermoplasmata archaeon]